MKSECNNTKVWEENTVIPTYKAGNPNKNPMFLEKRVYQGSSGRVYPHTVIDKISDTKENITYKALYLENDFIKVMVLPEIGGRIQRAFDKTNGYDFVYYNHVIKPALVGLAGPWISGGIEFNWPQHHRPSTFDPVDYSYCENSDGSATITVGEIENMFRTKCVTKITVYPDSMYIELKTTLYNRTFVPQTFLWWANPAVAVNDNTRSIFPSDVTAVMDHGKRAVSSFPIATGTYYKMDYSKGVDISKYKNIPVPTSYMAAKSDYDFVGGYDDGAGAGLLHVADHHISPGKKQWTWGNGDFGKAWDRNLTDCDGPYVELMTGCFTDNQPDFSWLSPFESKSFTQYFMPYQQLGTVHNANKDLVMNIENGSLNLFATGVVGEISILIKYKGKTVFNEAITMSALDCRHISFCTDSDYDECDAEVIITKNGREYLSFQKSRIKNEIPEAAVCPPDPENCETAEDLYLYGLHIEQYRHATYCADDYYLEGLKRDGTDIRLNNAYGMSLLRRGLVKESEQYFTAAIKKLTRSNPNPYDGEPYYNSGLALLYQNKLDESYDAFYKSAWNDALKAAAFYQMACIMCKKGQYAKALSHVEDAIVMNSHNVNALNLKVQLLDMIGEGEQAKAVCEDILKLDPLNYLAKLFLGEKISPNANTAIELAIQLSYAGLYKIAISILENNSSDSPLTYYYLAFYYDKAGDIQKSKKTLLIAEKKCPDGCFPHRLEDIEVLSFAIKSCPKNTMAYYYIGNLYYDKRRYSEAIASFTKCAEIFPEFPTAHRNLALAYFNTQNNIEKAIKEMEIAFNADTSDSRVLLELSELYKKANMPVSKRLEFLKCHKETVKDRDNLYLEYITLLNLTGEYQKAYDLIMSRSFHPWEGGEGKVPMQYIYSLVFSASDKIKNKDYKSAEGLILKTFTYPHNLGEGKLYGSQENLQNYILGIIYENQGEIEKSKDSFIKASQGLTEPASAMYYNDQPPETIFCQGMALLRLNEVEKANEIFNKLIDYADKHYNDEIKIDYFAVSLPDFLVFNSDLNSQNRVHCLFMKALGLLGQGETEKAKDCILKAKKENVSHTSMLVYESLFFNQ